MASVQIGLDQLDRLVAILDAKPAGIDSATSRVVRKAAFDVERHAKILAPFDTGFLKNSIHTEIAANNSRIYAAEVIADANYAAFLEYGTSRMAPQPYMGPALDRVAPGFIAAMEQIADPLTGGPGIGIGGAAGGTDPPSPPFRIGLGGAQ